MRLRLSLRLPVRFQNRWTYGSAAFLSSSLFAFGLRAADGAAWGWLLGLIPAGIAACVFPPAPRSRQDMTYSGVFVVLLSFLALGVLVLLAALADPAIWRSMGSFVWGMLMAAVLAMLILFAGSLITLGLPWWIGIAVSWLFVSEDGNSTDAALDEFMRNTLAKTEHEP